MIWFVAAAFAQDGATPAVPENVNAQNYRPTMDSERTLWADDAGHRLDGGAFKARVFLHYVHNPLVFYPPGDADRTVLVSDALQLDALAMYQFDRFRLGVDVPVYLVSAGELTQNGAGIGDIALDGRVTLSDRDNAPVGTALGARLTLPTASVDAPLGLPSLGADIFGILDTEIDKWLFTVNLGGRFVPEQELTNVKLNDQLFARVGTGWQLVDDAGISFDVNGNLNLGEFGNVAGFPIEGLLGGWGRIGEAMMIRGGVGTGFTPGIGSGDFRGVLTLGYEPRREADPDLDGLVGDEDQCPNDPEDKDQFEDLDGCPDPDNDKDGILDVDDQCASDPEDLDGFKDEDGCPDFTTQVTIKVKQQNGQPVSGAKARVQSDGVDESGGNNFVVDLHEGNFSVAAEAKDFLPGSTDFTVPLAEGQEEVVVVLQPDVIMGDLTLIVTDPAGAPLPNVNWFMDGGPGPAAMTNGRVTLTVPAGVHAIDVRHDGYVTERQDVRVPEKASKEVTIALKKSNVTVTAERIDIKGTVYFTTAKASIQSRSFGLLDDVASVMLDHPELTKVRIEGHTDSRGSANYNRTLSDKRAKAVRQYLVNKGVDGSRLEAIGYGEDKPVDPRETPEAWEKNRRVDFFIVERAD